MKAVLTEDRKMRETDALSSPCTFRLINFYLNNYYCTLLRRQRCRTQTLQLNAHARKINIKESDRTNTAGARHRRIVVVHCISSTSSEFPWLTSQSRRRRILLRRRILSPVFRRSNLKSAYLNHSINNVNVIIYCNGVGILTINCNSSTCNYYYSS